MYRLSDLNLVLLFVEDEYQWMDLITGRVEHSFPNLQKVARVINSASGNRPVVVLANLSGFDGSPESLRRLQLQLGAQIGRAVVNFVGKIIFVVIGRYHGGAYVVFSKALNPNLVAMAIEGSYASVIGGAPAAAVVFPREVNKRVKQDARIAILQDKIAKASSESTVKLRQELNDLGQEVMLEKRGEVAVEFDGIHSVQKLWKLVLWIGSFRQGI